MYATPLPFTLTLATLPGIDVCLEPLENGVLRYPPFLADFVGQYLTRLHFSSDNLDVHLKLFGQFSGGEKLSFLDSAGSIVQCLISFCLQSVADSISSLYAQSSIIRHLAVLFSRG